MGPTALLCVRILTPVLAAVRLVMRAGTCAASLLQAPSAHCIFHTGPLKVCVFYFVPVSQGDVPNTASAKQAGEQGKAGAGGGQWVYTHHKRPHTHDVRAMDVVRLGGGRAVLLSGGEEGACGGMEEGRARCTDGACAAGSVRGGLRWCHVGGPDSAPGASARKQLTMGVSQKAAGPGH